MDAGTRTVQHVSFVLLAEFDIDQGSILAHQYPYPTGTNEQLLAELMIPDGVHSHQEDWTIFFLNQTPGNTVSKLLVGDDEEEAGGKQELLYVLNLVRTKHDSSVRRGAVVKALAIATRYPYIQIFKNLLLIALEEYYQNPTVECLSRLFDAINAMDISLFPTLTREEKLIARVSERKDIFSEKFIFPDNAPTPHATTTNMNTVRGGAESVMGHKKNAGSAGSASHFSLQGGTRKLSLSTVASASVQSHSDTAAPSVASNSRLAPATGRSRSPSLTSISDDQVSSMGGSAIWVGQEDLTDSKSSLDPSMKGMLNSSGEDQSRKVSLERRSSRSSGITHSTNHGYVAVNSSSDGHSTGGKHQSIHHQHHHHPNHNHGGRQRHQTITRDTHYFETSIMFSGLHLPIRIPVTTFPEEIGEYSLIQLLQTFSGPNASISGPLHPHLHTNGALTPPIILLFNALITHKRVIFLGYGKPAGHVANFVLAACALGSGAGCHLRGFTERAFPYTNLTNNEILESVPGFIAGVTNPIYETIPMWDVLCNIETGKIAVHKDIRIVASSISSLPPQPTLNPRSGVVVNALGEDEMGRLGKEKDGGGSLSGNGAGTTASSIASKTDSYDVQFIEDVRDLCAQQLTSSVSQNFGETIIRWKFSEYVIRFLRIASRIEETLAPPMSEPTTTIGFPCHPFSETGVSGIVTGTGVAQGFGGSLGTGLCLVDENVGAKEMSANASRIEGWRGTPCYEYWKEDFQSWLGRKAIKDVDVLHQISKLRNGKNVSDAEVDLILRTFYFGVRSYEQIVELLAGLPPHLGGLMPLTFGLFHQNSAIRETTVDLLNIIRTHHIGNQFVNSLNAFHRFAYIQLLERRKRDELQQQKHQEQVAAQQHQQAQIAQQLYASATSSTANSSSDSYSQHSHSHHQSVSSTSHHRPSTSSSVGSTSTQHHHLLQQQPSRESPLPPIPPPKSKRETAGGFASQLIGSMGINGSMSISRSGSTNRGKGSNGVGTSSFGTAF